MTRTIDVLRVTTDASYAAALSPDEWYTVAESPQWAQMMAEQRELVQSTLDTHGHMLPGYAQQVAPPTAPEILNGPYSVVGTKAPRVQGLGIVTGLGQYTEHM